MVEMVIRLEDESLLMPLKRVMKSLLGITDVVVRRNTSNTSNVRTRDEVYSLQLLRLEELAGLKENWDDDGALPIESKTIRNVKQLIERADDSDLEKWVIFPDVNGTILLESKSGDAVISIGNHDFSYSGKNQRGSHERLTTASLLNVMRQITA